MAGLRCLWRKLIVTTRAESAASVDFGVPFMHSGRSGVFGNIRRSRVVRVLLLAMPDSFEHMPTVAVRMPNGALTTLAGNVDAHHRVAAADLILVQSKVRETVERLVREIQPDVVGLSVMTFQRKTALRIVQLVRSLRPAVRVVAGGYDPSLAPEAYMEDNAGIDFIVRGEGELTFRDLLRAMENGQAFDGIQGLSYRSDGTWRQNPARPVHSLDGDEIRQIGRAHV